MKIKNFLYKIAFVFVISSFLFAPYLVSAQGDVPNKNLYPCDGPDCKFEHIILLAQGVAKELFKYALILSSLIFVYVGWLLISSSSNPGQRKQAGKIAQNVVIGLLIMMLAWTVVSLFVRAIVDDSVTNDPSFPISKP